MTENTSVAEGSESKIRVAAIQMEPRVGEKKTNVDETLDWIHRAAKEGARLVVLPELCNTGYVFETREEAFSLAERVPDGPTCRSWLKAAHENNVSVVAGIAEKDGPCLYNTAILAGPEGFIGKYRKLHLFHRERLFFELGNLGLPIFYLPFGRVGLIVCRDAWFPEVARIYALQGADLICDPTDWALPEEKQRENFLAPYIHLATAIVNTIFMICANRVGLERGFEFPGSSCIIGPSGFLAGPASMDKSEMVTAEINVVSARYKKTTALTDRIADRRVDVYDSMLGYKGIDGTKR